MGTVCTDMMLFTPFRNGMEDCVSVDDADDEASQKEQQEKIAEWPGKPQLL
jgi:hypothetical protein